MDNHKLIADDLNNHKLIADDLNNHKLIVDDLNKHKGQYMISYCQRAPISLKILLNISSLISAQFCNEICAYE